MHYYLRESTQDDCHCSKTLTSLCPDTFSWLAHAYDPSPHTNASLSSMYSFILLFQWSASSIWTLNMVQIHFSQTPHSSSSHFTHHIRYNLLQQENIQLATHFFTSYIKFLYITPGNYCTDSLGINILYSLSFTLFNSTIRQPFH